MKIVPKLLGGGGLSSLFTIYNVAPALLVLAPSRSNSEKESVSVKDSSKSSDKDTTKGKLTEKDLFDMIKDVDGLPNEMKSIISSLKTTLSTLNLIGVDTGQLSSMYLDSLYKLKVANLNKERFDESVKTAKENGSIGEVAITLSGNLLTSDKNGKIHEISLELYLSNPEEYKLLTNSNLAWLRKYSPSMAFSGSDEAFEIINNGVGFESFQKLLDQAKSTLGSYKYEELGIIGKEALAGLKTLQGKSDAEKLKLISSVTGNTVEYSTSLDSNVENVKALITYLSNALPKRARVWASIKTRKSEQEAITTLVGLYLSSSIKDNNLLKIDIPSGKKSSGSSSGSSSELDKMEMNTPMKFLDGEGVSGTYILNPGTSRAVQVVTNTMPLTNAEGKPIGTNSTLLEAASGEYAGVLDMAHATIGGRTIDPASFGSIIVKEGKISSLDYPCIIKENGEIIPNTSPELAKAKQEAEKLLRSKGVNVSNPEHIKKYWKAINAAYKQYGLSEAYNDLGLPIGNWRRFGIVNVAASDKALGLDDLDDNPLLKEITNDSTIDNLILITKDDEFNKKGFFNSITGSYNRFYEGTLWIPLDVNYQAAAISTKTTAGQTRALEEAQLAADLRRNWNTPHQI